MTPYDLPDPPGAGAAAGLDFDGIAVTRGDGLLPELRRLLSGLDRPHADGAVTDIADYLPATGRQSGPHPRGHPDPMSAPGVLPFPDHATDRHQQRAQRKRAGKEA